MIDSPSLKVIIVLFGKTQVTFVGGEVIELHVRTDDDSFEPLLTLVTIGTPKWGSENKG